MPNENFYDPAFFKDPSHIYIGPAVIVNGLDAFDHDPELPIYVETPIAYWKIYVSPYRPKIVLDHKHKPDGKWHNQGAWGVFTNVPAAIHYIKKHDWIVKGCSKNDSMFISERLGTRPYSDVIYCLTTKNKELHDKLVKKILPKSYLQGLPKDIKPILQTDQEYIIYNTTHLYNFNHVFHAILNEIGLIEIVKEFNIEVLEERRDGKYEKKGYKDFSDIPDRPKNFLDRHHSRGPRSYIKEQMRKTFPKRIPSYQNLLLLNTHSLEEKQKADISQRISLAFGLTNKEAFNIIEQKQYFSQIPEKALQLLQDMCLDYELELKYMKIEQSYEEMRRNKTIYGSRVEIIDRDIPKILKKMEDIQHFFLHELKLSKNVLNHALDFEGAELPISLLITRGNQAETKKQLVKYGFKVRLNRMILQKVSF